MVCVWGGGLCVWGGGLCVWGGGVCVRWRFVCEVEVCVWGGGVCVRWRFVCQEDRKTKTCRQNESWQVWTLRTVWSPDEGRLKVSLLLFFVLERHTAADHFPNSPSTSMSLLSGWRTETWSVLSRLRCVRSFVAVGRTLEQRLNSPCWCVSGNFDVWNLRTFFRWATF